MGELLGVPEWVAATAFVVAALALWLGMGTVLHRRAMACTAARRSNPSEEEFLTLLAPACSPEAAQFVWQQALPYIAPRLTPHPDDHLGDDLCIDEGDIEMDWVSDWADQLGIPERDLPEWQQDWPLTVRNFARWCDLDARPLPLGEGRRINAPAG